MYDHLSFDFTYKIWSLIKTSTWKEKLSAGHLDAEKRLPCNALFVSRWTYNHLSSAHKTVLRLHGQFINYAMFPNNNKQKRKINLSNSQDHWDLELFQLKDLFHKRLPNQTIFTLQSLKNNRNQSSKDKLKLKLHNKLRFFEKLLSLLVKLWTLVILWFVQELQPMKSMRQFITLSLNMMLIHHHIITTNSQNHFARTFFFIKICKWSYLSRNSRQ